MWHWRSGWDFGQLLTDRLLSAVWCDARPVASRQLVVMVAVFNFEFSSLRFIVPQEKEDPFAMGQGSNS